MRISENEKAILIVRDHDWLGGLVMTGFGVLFAVIGILMLIEFNLGGLIMIAISAAISYAFYRLIAIVQTKFDRVDGTVEISEKTLHGRKLTSYPLAEVSGTIVKEKFSSMSGGQKTKQSQINLILKNSDGLFPLNRSFSSGTQYQQIASTIDDWLEND